MFGIGGLIGPFIIYIFEGNTYTVFGLLIAASIPWFMMINSPELNGFEPEKRKSNVAHSKVISDTLEYALCLFMFFYLGT